MTQDLKGTQSQHVFTALLQEAGSCLTPGGVEVSVGALQVYEMSSSYRSRRSFGMCLTQNRRLTSATAGAALGARSVCATSFIIFTTAGSVPLLSGLRTSMARGSVQCHGAP